MTANYAGQYFLRNKKFNERGVAEKIFSGHEQLRIVCQVEKDILTKGSILYRKVVSQKVIRVAIDLFSKKGFGSTLGAP